MLIQILQRTVDSAAIVLVSPLTGMWLETIQCSGSGNVTIFTGAGSGEEQHRYKLQSWPYVSFVCLLPTFSKMFISPSKNVY